MLKVSGSRTRPSPLCTLCCTRHIYYEYIVHCLPVLSRDSVCVHERACDQCRLHGLRTVDAAVATYTHVTDQGASTNPQIPAKYGNVNSDIPAISRAPLPRYILNSKPLRITIAFVSKMWSDVVALLAFAYPSLVCVLTCMPLVRAERGDYRGCRAPARTIPLPQPAANQVAAGDLSGCIDWCEDHFFR